MPVGIYDRTKSKPRKRGELNHMWRGGIKRKCGYILIYSPNHPFRDKTRYVWEHRLVVEKHIGRYLKPKEQVHHVNHNKKDNQIQNLMVFKNAAYHFWYHKHGFCNLKGIIFDGRDIL